MKYTVERPTGWPLLVRALVTGTGLVLMVAQSQYLHGETALDVIRWAMLGTLCIMLAFRPPGRLQIRRQRIVDAIFIAFVTLAFASAMYTSYVPVTVQRAASTLLLYVAVFWTLWYYVDLVGQEKLTDALIATAAVVFGLGMLNFFITDASLMRGRFRGVMENPNAIGMLTIIFLPLVISRYIRRRKVADLALIVVIVTSVVLSGSRNGVMTASLSVLFLLWRTRAWKPAIFIALAGAVLVLATPESNTLQGLESRPQLTRLLKGEKKSVTSGRAEAWQVAIPIVQRRLIFGHGFGTEDRIFDGLSFRIHRGLYVHNSYIGMTYQLGLVGSVVLFLPLLVLLFSRAFSRRTDSLEVASCEAVLFGGLVAALFESWVYSVGNAFAFPFWICVMLVIRNGVRAAAAAPAGATASLRPVTSVGYALPDRPLVASASSQRLRRFDPPTAGYR